MQCIATHWFFDQASDSDTIGAERGTMPKDRLMLEIERGRERARPSSLSSNSPLLSISSLRRRSDFFTHALFRPSPTSA